MKRKKVTHLLGMVTAIALVMSLFLPGCGGSGGSPSYGNNAPAPSAAAPSPAPSSSMASGGGMKQDYSPAEPEEDFSADGGEATWEMPQFQMPDSRKIIRHMSMDLETRTFTEAIQSIQTAVAEAGGYIESQNQEGYSLGGNRSRYQERYASIQARVPSGKLDEVARSVGGFCNVLSQSENMDDITDSYYDAQSHLKSLRIQEERLLAILEKAEKLEDIITLENALTDVQYQIENLTASLRRMDSQVAYSYLNISLREVVEYQEVQEKPRSFGEQMREAFGDGMGDMVDGLQTFALFLARVGPSLVVLVLIIVGIAALIQVCRKAAGKQRKNKFDQWYPAPPPAQVPPAAPQQPAKPPVDTSEK